MEGEKIVVCVTGGTGYIASWLIMRLLQQGFSVRATIRGPKEGAGYLTNLPGASENLKIFDADLDKPDSFSVAIAGCVGVFHVAHPMNVEGKEPEEVVTKRAVEGTLGVLKACVDSKTVKRVVLTSSVAAVESNKEGYDIIDENSWTDIDICRSLKLRHSSYAISKTVVEKAALEFADKHGLDLVTVLPSVVVGPFITPKPPGSVSVALALISGKGDQWSYSVATHMVHVDDVVSAHIFLLDCPNAKGRYICNSHDFKVHELAEFLYCRYPEFQLPNPESLTDIQDHRSFSYSSKKLLDLGFKFKYSPGEMYDGAIQSCKEKGFLNISRGQVRSDVSQ